jgi:hypothetical protein
MNPKEKRRYSQVLLYLFAVAFPCLALGIIMIGGTIFYVDCSRIAGTVNCVITTRLLGTFVTETYTASGVTHAMEFKDCDNDDCRYHIELATTYGMEPYFVDSFLNESKAKEVKQINAYLMDSSQQAFHIKVVYWRLFILFAVYIFIGGVGLFLALILAISLLRAKMAWQPVLQAKNGEGNTTSDWPFSKVDIGPPPQGLRMEREITRLRFHYRHPAKKGLIWLLLGAGLAGWGWISGEPIRFWILMPCGLLMLYVGLVTLFNQWTIQVKYDELMVRFAPIPFYYRRRRIPSREILQLYVEPRTVYTRSGKLTYYVLEAVLQDKRRISLLSELPYDVLHYIELQIESWLKLEDRWVVGEAFSAAPEGAAERKGTSR